MKKFVFAVFCIIVLAGCGGVFKPPGLTPAQPNQDLITWAEAGAKAVNVLRGAAELVIPLACMAGQMDPSMCSDAQKAIVAAGPVLSKVDIALAAYKADPSTANASVLDAARTAALETWSTLNDVNGKMRFVDDQGNLIPFVPKGTSPLP